MTSPRGQQTANGGEDRRGRGLDSEGRPSKGTSLAHNGAAIAGFQKLIGIGFFKSTWTFEFNTVVYSRPDARTIMDTLCNRTGLKNHVDLAKLRFAN